MGLSEHSLSLRLSSSLVQKLTEKAAVEGVGVDELASELLAEGLVLRAWEIIEKKNAMRGPTNSSHHYNNNRNQKSGSRGANYYSRKPGADASPRFSQQSYNNIMKDGASFLEYVRSQERGKRV